MKNEVHLIDCMEFMKTVPYKFFDMAVVDPEYGINAGKGTEIYLSNNKKYNCRGKKKNDKTIYGDWDKKPPDKKYFLELFRISKNQIIWGGNYFIEHLYSSPGWIVWNKLNGDSFFADGELAWTSFKRKLRIFNFLSCGFMGSHKNRDIRIHPTQKPVALYKWILQNYAKPGWKIFDSHIGSGSSRIAAYDMGFSFEGCENNKEIWQAQEERFKNHIANVELFDKEEIQESIYQEKLL